MLSTLSTSNLPNRMLERDASIPSPLHPRWLPIALIVFCFLPRAWMAWRLDTMCLDGVYYIETAQLVANGELQQAFGHSHFSLYPVILAGLHKLGLPWEIAGKLWGVAVSTLLVLPLFGWIRRQYNLTIALLACALYSVHPGLIETAPEILRDSTFWLLFVLTIYVVCRAVQEESLLWFTATGVSLAATVLCRVEGAFLAIPIVCWSFTRGVHSSIRPRTRLGVGLVGCLCLTATLVVAANYTVPNARHDYSVFRNRYVALLFDLFDSPSSDEPTPTATAPEAKPEGRSPQATLAASTAGYLNRFQRALDPFFIFLLFIGIVEHWQLWKRSDSWPLTLVGICVCASIWIYWRSTSGLNSRYFFSLLLVEIPFAALGLASLANWCAMRTAHWKQSWSPARAGAVIFGLLAIIGCTDAISSNLDNRRIQRETCAWLQDQLGRHPIGDNRRITVASYGLHDRYFRHYGPQNSLVSHVELGRRRDPMEQCCQNLKEASPDILVFRNSQGTDLLTREALRIGLRAVDPPALPVDARFTLMLRDDSLRMALEASNTTGTLWRR